METGSGGNGRSAEVLRELDAARAALARGAFVETIGYLELGKQLCGRLAAPGTATAPTEPTEPDEALGIKAVSAITGYSVQRLRHIGKDLPGYKKWPNGKVTWWRSRIVAYAQGTA